MFLLHFGEVDNVIKKEISRLSGRYPGYTCIRTVHQNPL
jgi:hypothetical protein